MKKPFSVALFFSVFFFSSPVFAFEDVDSSPHQEAIEYLEDSGVVEGYSGDVFRPYSTINRAEFTKIVMEQLFPGESSGENCFRDVEDDWYADYVCEAESRGIVSGYPDGKFYPEAEINLAEALSVVLHAYDIDVSDDYQEWYDQYYWTASSVGLLETLNAEIFDSISRGEMAQLIYNILLESGEVDDPRDTVELPPDEDYEIYETTNDTFDLMDLNVELETTVVAVEKENVAVLVPEGYEELGKAYVNDLLYCEPLLGDFFGFEFPNNELVAKIYISSDDSNQGSSAFGQIYYRRSQENIDTDLENVLTNNPDGFLYNSSPSYCANSHELTHAFFYSAPIPSWFEEGLAEFTQKYNQGDVKDSVSCEEYGYYRDEEYSSYPNLREDLDYPSSMCLVETLVHDPSDRLFKNLMTEIYAFIEDSDLESEYLDIIPDGNGEYGTEELTFSKVLMEVLGTDVSEDLIKYGIDLEAMNLL